MLAICVVAKPVVFKAPKTSSNAERVSHGKMPRAKPGHKKHLTSSKQPSVSITEATKDGQTSASTLVVAEMHKEDQQAIGDPKSLGVIRYDASAYSIAEADPGISAPNVDPHVLVDKTQSASEGLETVHTTANTEKGPDTIAKQIEEPNSDEASKIIKLEDLAKLVPNVKADFIDLDSLEDDSIIVVDES
ncbi:hypothetical protein Tco_0100394, partial [Tanacetum coccineum]